MKEELYIPEKIRIGFQTRKDTFTGKLAYVIYFDDKNVLRKETSWENWRDKKIPYIDIDNVPTNGFILNKGVQRYGYHGSGRSVIRIHDPREFEFEISIDNLVGLLMNYDVSKRDIQGECVFAWAGKDLVLLPVNSIEYTSSKKYTEKQGKKLSTKELVKGRTYSQKKSDQLLKYLGYFEWFELNGYYSNINKKSISKGKKHIFYDENYNFSIPGISTFADCESEDIDQNYTKAFEKFEKSTHSAALDKVLRLKPTIENNEGRYKSHKFYKDYGKKKTYEITFNSHSNKEKFEYLKDRTYIDGLTFNAYTKVNDEYVSDRNVHGYIYLSRILSPIEKMFIKDVFNDTYSSLTKEEVIERLKQAGYEEIYITNDKEVKERI